MTPEPPDFDEDSAPTDPFDPFGVATEDNESPRRPRHLRGGAAGETAPTPTRARWTKRERRRYLRRRILALFVIVFVLLTPVWISLGSALGNQSYGPSASARLAEWARDHGGAGFVSWIENEWYRFHPPKVGGQPAKGAIPGAVHLKKIGAGANVLPTPAALKPFVSHPQPGEGTWHPIGRTVNGVPTMYDTFMRPDPLHTSTVVGVVWMDTKMLDFRLYSGSYIPGGGPYRYTAPVTPAAAKTLVAGFNAGFRMKDAQGGYYTDGKTIIPLRVGGASVVVYKNGTVNIAKWGRDAKLTKNVESVRQNLVLLVDNGKAVTGLNPNDTYQWGYTVGSAVYVWRSGIGITKNGALVYVGGPGLNITTLANLLVRAGAVRAMELDINSAWVNFSYFDPTTPKGPATATNGTNLLPAMAYTPAHLFESWWARDRSESVV